MFDIIFEDDVLLVVNKPSGIPVIPDRYGTHAKSILSHFKELFPDISTAHRIDLETSGVFVMIKLPLFASHIARQFEEHTVHKEYLAIVQGGMKNCVTHKKLIPDADNRHRTFAHPSKGVSAETEFILLEKFRSHSLVRAIPRTGRTHQIRIHAQDLGHPLVADELYGGKPLALSQIKSRYKAKGETELPLMARVALHAEKLSLIHPKTLENISFFANLPKDFERCLQNLRKYS